MQIKIKKNKEDWHNWFAWFPVYESDDCLEFFWLQTIQRKWIRPQAYGHYGNYIYRELKD